MSSSPAGRAAFLPSLDGWRALAISLVLASHAWAARDVPPTLATWLSSYGDLGVRIFLVLSGFLISRLLMVEHDRSGRIDLKAFYVRRTLRIFPVYFLFLSVLALLQAAGLYRDTLSTWLGALTFTRNMVGHGGSLTDHLWSLAVEEQFYLIWPAILGVLMLARARLGVYVAVVAVLALPVVIRSFPCDGDSIVCLRLLGPRSLPRYADSLGAGCIAAWLTLRWAPTAFTARTYMLGGVVALLLAVAVEHAPVGLPVRSLAITAQAVSVAFAMAASIHASNSLLFAVLNTRLVSYIGRLSYSLYIWHMLFLAHYAGAKLAGWPIYHWSVCWIGMIGAAMASYHGFERPILRFKETYARRVSQGTESRRTA